MYLKGTDDRQTARFGGGGVGEAQVHKPKRLHACVHIDAFYSALRLVTLLCICAHVYANVYVRMRTYACSRFAFTHMQRSRAVLLSECLHKR